MKRIQPDVAVRAALGCQCNSDKEVVMSSSIALASDGCPVGYVNKRDGARYIGRSARWLNPHLPAIGFYRTDSGRVFLKLSDLDAFMQRFRVVKEVENA